MTTWVEMDGSLSSELEENSSPTGKQMIDPCEKIEKRERERKRKRQREKLER